MRQTSLRKKRKYKHKTPYEQAHEKAWQVFSRWVRLRDPRCITCGEPSENAGHFRHNCLDFDEQNINGQCVRCNKWLSGNLAVYATYLVRKYGSKVLDQIDKRRSKIYSLEELQIIIKKYDRSRNY